MLVLDANILMRAVLGKGAKALLTKYADRVTLVAPDTAFHEARQRLPEVIVGRRMDSATFMAYFESLSRIIQTVDAEVYAGFEEIARARLARRDEDDWPILAAALALRYPIWTEDSDFFGCGVATWTTDRVEIYLAQMSSPPPA